ncbi:hypothetical protein DY000_02003468 [Brassica cretica]|uniref:Uncharacterized protein n=1 Tax=Brassica cretica TaxID=69181 RepID=A0ABQ7CB10_BRACR|nr:hypothetical protein DY000_02003468 [Brassica cretica]
MALASRIEPVCVCVDTGRGTTFGVLEISTWFIHPYAANNQKLHLRWTLRTENHHCSSTSSEVGSCINPPCNFHHLYICSWLLSIRPQTSSYVLTSEGRSLGRHSFKFIHKSCFLPPPPPEVNAFSRKNPHMPSHPIQ